MDEDVEELKTKLTVTERKLLDILESNRRGLKIARVPQATKEEFIKLATEEFCGDYGMLLKWLMDGLVKADMKTVMQKLDEVDTRLNELESAVQSVVAALEATNEEKSASGRRMLDGSTKQVKRP